MPTYSITRLPTSKGSLQGETVDLEEEQLAAEFTTYTVGASKEGPALIPGRLRHCPPTGCLNKGRVNCGGGHFHRIDENVEGLSGLMLDSDEGDVHAVIGRLVADGITHFVWQTYSHTSAIPKHRVFIPFARELPIKSKQQWSRVFWPALVRWAGLDPEKAEAIDKQCKNASRLYYAPRKPEGGAQRAWVHWGKELDWATVPGIDLEAVPLAPYSSPAYRDPARPEGEFAVDLAGLRERLLAVRADAVTRQVLANLVKGEALCPPASRREKGDRRNRYDCWLKATVWIANCAAGNEHAEELLEVARASHERECIEADAAHEEATSWAKIEKQLEGAMCDAPEYRAQEAHRRGLREFAAALGKRGEAGSPAATDAADAPDAPPVDWQGLVTMGKNKEGETVVKATSDNIGPILRYHPVWAGAFKFNEYKAQVEVWGGPTLGEGPPGRAVTGNDNQRAAQWFVRQFGYKLNAKQMTDFICDAADACRYHPLRDYLNACKASGSKHPGILNTWLQRFCNAHTEHEGKDISDLISTYGRKFLISAVARAYRPGSKVDTMPVFVGRQGARKSTLLSVLADNGRFFTDASITFDGAQNTSMIIATNWIVEAPELEGMARGETLKQRATLSRRVDTFRLPYGMAIVNYPRISVFAGTTNESEFLTDSAGNRRFWVIEVGEVDIESLTDAVPSLWAEAVAAYEAGEQWWLTEAEQGESSLVNEQHMGTDNLAEKLRAAVAKDPKAKDFYTVPEILTFLELPAGGMTKSIANNMRRAGFTPSRRYLSRPGSTHLYRARGYTPPPELRRDVEEKSNVTPIDAAVR